MKILGHWAHDNDYPMPCELLLPSCEVKSSRLPKTGEQIYLCVPNLAYRATVTGPSPGGCLVKFEFSAVPQKLMDELRKAKTPDVMNRLRFFVLDSIERFLDRRGHVRAPPISNPKLEWVQRLDAAAEQIHQEWEEFKTARLSRLPSAGGASEDVTGGQWNTIGLKITQTDLVDDPFFKSTRKLLSEIPGFYPVTFQSWIRAPASIRTAELSPAFNAITWALRFLMAIARSLPGGWSRDGLSTRDFCSTTLTSTPCTTTRINAESRSWST